MLTNYENAPPVVLPDPARSAIATAQVAVYVPAAKRSPLFAKANRSTAIESFQLVRLDLAIKGYQQN